MFLFLFVCRQRPTFRDCAVRPYYITVLYRRNNRRLPYIALAGLWNYLHVITHTIHATCITYTIARDNYTSYILRHARSMHSKKCLNFTDSFCFLSSNIKAITLDPWHLVQPSLPSCSSFEPCWSTFTRNSKVKSLLSTISRNCALKVELFPGLAKTALKFLSLGEH